MREIVREIGNHNVMPQSHCHKSIGDSVRMLAIRAIRMRVRIMENKNAPEVDNLLNNEPTRIDTVQIANDGEPSTTENNELEPTQIRTG